MTASPAWLVWAILSALFAALTAIFAKLGLEGIDSDYATLLRTCVIIAVLGLWVAGTGKWRNPADLPIKSLTFLWVSGLASGASWACYFRALKLGPASQVAPIDKLSVVLVALFAVAVLGERPTPQAWVGITCIGVGVLILSLQS